MIDLLAYVFELLGPREMVGDEEHVVPMRYRSKWFLSPRQHAIEFVCYLIVFLSMLYVSLRQTRNQSNFAAHRLVLRNNTSFLDVFMAVTCFACCLANIYYKGQSPGQWRIPYLFQPCHTLTLFLGLCCLFSGTSWNVIFQIYTSLSWSSVLALSFPDMDDYEYMGDIICFWIEHVIMLAFPLVLVSTGKYSFRGGFSWTCTSYSIMGLYHSVIIQFIALITRVNVATFMAPPAILSSAGKYYRPIQFLFCFVLHCIYCALVNMLLSFFTPSTASKMPKSKHR